MTPDFSVEAADLRVQVADLEERLRESEETLDAIRRGEVDALVVGGRDDEHRIYTLESADRPYQILIEQIQEGTVTLNDEGTVLYCNRRLADMLCVPQERVVGQSLYTFVSPKDNAAFHRLLDEAKRSVGRGELTLCVGGGSTTAVYMSLSVLRREGTSTLLCGVLTDLTEQKLHLGALAAANLRLTEEIAERERIETVLRQSQKMEAVGQLTGGLAHDFNNLLTGIMASLELLQRRIGQGRVSDVDRYVNAAQGAANRAAALTQRLLAFSRQQTLEPKPTSVGRLVNGLRELIGRTVSPEIHIAWRADPDLWMTLVDRSQLENALLNLCINARDAMPDGGSLSIDARNLPVGATLAADLDLLPGDYVTLAVKDSGTGMSDDVIAKAFDPFFTTKPIGQGTGLGLSMIYGFVKQSHGQVQIASTIGQGTTVRLYLPRCVEHEEDCEAVSSLSDAPRANRGETVLVVDDEPTIRMLVVELLEDLGYIAREAANGAAALSLLQSRDRLDLLITDVGLPGGMNGRQVADIARTVRPSLKVIFITGFAHTAAIRSDDLAPGMHVMVKPFTLEALATRIKETISN